MLTLIRKWLPIVIVAFLVVPCAAKPKTRTRDPDKAVRLSDDTRQVLRLYLIEGLASKDATEALRRLDSVLPDEHPRRQRKIEIAMAELAIDAAQGTKVKTAPRTVVGFYLCAAYHAHRAGADYEAEGPAPAASFDPDLQTALDAYNHAVSRLVSILQDARGFDSYPIEIRGPIRRYTLDWRDRDDGLWARSQYRFVAANEIRVKGLQNHYVIRGAGSPLVAVRLESAREPATEKGFFPSYELAYPVTALMRFETRGTGSVAASLEMFDPLARDTIEISGLTLPLAADLTAPIAILAGEIDLSGIAGTLRSEKRLDDTGLYLLEPYHRDKIPVVFVHGLLTDAVTWGEMYNDLQGDPVLRSSYQFWFFNYATALPIPYSAMLLRQSLTGLAATVDPEGDDPALMRTVIVGHSMGGLLARLQVTRSGSALWDSVFTRPPDELELSSKHRQILEEIYFFEPLPFVRRVVFISTPHRGVAMAQGAAGKIGSKLVKLPGEMSEAAEEVLRSNESALTPGAAEKLRMPTGIDTLAVDDVTIVALQSIPIDESATYHSIVADRGKGGGGESSDGLVPYSSSHLEGAESELIVPTGHKSHVRSPAIAEVRRILLEHLEED